MLRKILLVTLFLSTSACGLLGRSEGPAATATQGAPETPVPAASATALPIPPTATTAPTETVAASATVAAASPTAPPPPTLTPTPVPTVPTPTVLASGLPILGQHAVAPRESLFCIGRAYGVLPAAIAQANGMLLDSILPEGRVLLIPAVPWTAIPPGPVCPAQFASPYAGALPPSATPAPAGTVDPRDIRGPEAILILLPGMTSSVTSPVHVAGESDPVFEQSLVVQITDVDGRVIAMVPVQIEAPAGQRGPFGVDVAFSVAADQPGRISVYATSARDGGLLHLSSVEVTLRAGGTPAIVPGQPRLEPFAIASPAFQATVTGGTIRITGYSTYVFESSLGVTLCGEGGSGEPDFVCGTRDNVIAVGPAAIASPDIGLPGPFSAELQYSVAAPVRARVVIIDASPRDGGILHAVSQEITLAP